MWFRVAQWLHCTPEEAQERVSSYEFSRFIAFYLVEPWGYEPAMYAGGVVAATVANVAPRKKGAKALQPHDFYPKRKQPIKLSPRQEAELRERKRRKKDG